MAKYIQYVPEVNAGLEDGVHVWWFPEEFSQSRLGDRIIGSNACTLIAALISGHVDDFSIQIWGYFDQPLSRLLITAIAESIVEGNEIHEMLRATGQLFELNLSVPEALEAVNYKYPFLQEWGEKTRVLTTSMRETLGAFIESVFIDWTQNPPADKKENSDLFAVVVADTRTVLFIYQPSLGKVTLIDTHSHGPFGGAVVAQARTGDVARLCRWFSTMIYNCFSRADISLFEVAYLYCGDPYL